tara:strand:+ start:143 stop:499 length:357 start_codon:yes stop_codon:yes gene_type:complete
MQKTETYKPTENFDKTTSIEHKTIKLNAIVGCMKLVSGKKFFAKQMQFVEICKKIKYVFPKYKNTTNANLLNRLKKDLKDLKLIPFSYKKKMKWNRNKSDVPYYGDDSYYGDDPYYDD